MLRKSSINGNSRKVYLLGGHITKFIGSRHPDFIHKRHPDFGKKENPSLEDYIKDAAVNALKSTKVDPSLIERAWIGNFAGELFSSQGHLGAALVGSVPELKFKPVSRLEAACASGGISLASGAMAIQTGVDVAMVVGAEVQTTVSARKGAEYLARAADFKRQRSIDDFTFPALFARRIKHLTEAGIISNKDLAKASAKAYANANKNPLAHMKAVTMTEETASDASDKNPNFLSNEELKPFLKLSDCSQVSDGGAACILVSEDGLKKVGARKEDCIEIIGLGHATGNLFEDSNPLKMETVQRAAQEAYEQCGINPSTDIQIGEVHDCFTVAELLMYEALGLSDQGKAGEFIRSGATQLDGKVPINTGGGLVGFGHPVGATGVKQILEIYRQMKGQCEDYQISKIPEIGVCSNMGGDDKTAVVSVLRNIT